MDERKLYVKEQLVGYNVTMRELAEMCGLKTYEVSNFIYENSSDEISNIIYHEVKSWRGRFESVESIDTYLKGAGIRHVKKPTESQKLEQTINKAKALGNECLHYGLELDDIKMIGNMKARGDFEQVKYISQYYVPMRWLRKFNG